MLVKKVKNTKLAGQVSGKLILIIFAVFIILNLFALIGYTIYNKHQQELAFKEELQTQIIDTLHLVDINPEEELTRIASLSQTPELKVNVSTQPQFSLTLKASDVWQLEKYIEQGRKDFQISIQTSNGQWLNFSFDPHQKALIVQVIIISLETIMAIMLLFFAWYIERFTKPLRAFKKAAEQMGIHLTAKPLVEYGPPIVKETAEAMNLMQKRIITLINDRTRMLAAISHDLRTPITRMKLQASMMQEKDAAHELVADLDEMEQMIDQILVFTREANSHEETVLLDISALLMSLVNDKVDQGYQVEFQGEEKLLSPGRKIALKRAFVNILNNAVKYAHHVKVTVKSQKDQIVVTVEDDGPGIPEVELPKVFSPFYRIDQARSSETGGSGLGLAITQDIIRHHHGTISLENLESGGLRVTICLNLLK